MPAERRTQLQEAFKLALSVTIFYALALSLNWPSPKNGVIAIAVISLATVGESLNKGLLRIAGTAMGVAAGLVLITWCGQSRWGFLLVTSAYLVAVSYVVLESKYASAWFLAAITAVTVWSSSYPYLEGAFGVGLARFVETAGGVVVYLVVSLAFWPRSAAGQLDTVARQILEGLRDLAHREGVRGELAEDTEKLRATVAGLWPAFDKALAAAVADSPAVKARAGAWHGLSRDARSFEGALQLFHLVAGDNQDVDLGRAVPDLGRALRTVRRRLDRTVELWRTRDEPAAIGDRELLAPQSLALHGAAAMSHADRMRVTQLVRQFERVDETSRSLLETVRVVAGLDRSTPASGPPSVRPSRWDAEQLLQALFPALCFVVAYLLWIYTNPPAGRAVTILGVVFGLVLMQLPMNLFKILTLLLIGIVVVSPLYMIVLPRLSSGAELLGLVFASVFGLGLLGGKLAALRTLGIVTFAVVANVTNRQSYSFLGVLYPAIMMCLATVVVMLVYSLSSPMHPEKVLLRSVARFFKACARLTRLFAGERPEDRARREHVFRAELLPASKSIESALQNLDYQRFPDNTRERVQRMADALQLTLLRIEAIDAVASTSVEVPEGLRQDLAALRGVIESVYRGWSRAPGASISEEQKAALERLAKKLRGELDLFVDAGRVGDDELRDAWALLGSVRGLIETMNETQEAMMDLHWDQWAVARF